MKLSKATVFVLIVAFLNLIYNATLPLHFDEAYYLLWTKNLALSYFDHPPMIGWMLKIITFIGESEWVLRLVPFFCMSAIGLIIWQLANQAFNRQTADLAIVLYMVLPIVHIGFLLATPDAPVNLFWALTLYSAYQILYKENSATTKWWILTGVFFGCALLSKYTAVLLLPSLIIAILFSPKRKELFSLNFILATITATIIFSPVIYWNYQHEWASFAFQFNHGIAQEKVFNGKYFLEFIGGQAGSLTPLIFLGLMYCSIRFLPENLKQNRLAFFFWPFIFPMLFFAYAAMFKRSAANWAVPANISGLILLSYWATKQNWRIWKISSIVMAVVLVIMLKLPMLFSFLPPKAVLLSQFNGEPQVFANLQLDANTYVLADSYKSASLASYYIQNEKAVNVFNPKRVSMFDFWAKEKNITLPRKAIYIGRRDDEAELKEVFSKVEKLPEIKYQDNYLQRTFFVYKVEKPLKQGE